jgi:hypothetical protein
MRPGAEFFLRDPAITIGVQPRESRRAMIIELSALDPTIAVPVQPCKFFGDPPGNSLLRCRPHLLLGDHAVAIGIHAQEAHLSDSASFSLRDPAIAVQIEMLKHPLAMVAGAVLCTLSQDRRREGNNGCGGNYSKYNT